MKILLLLLFVMGCSTEKSYPVIGVITEIHKERQELTIHHDEIENFMMAMTMNFKLKPDEDIKNFSIGDSMHFKLVFDSSQGYATSFKIIDNVEVDATNFMRFDFYKVHYEMPETSVSGRDSQTMSVTFHGLYDLAGADQMCGIACRGSDSGINANYDA